MREYTTDLASAHDLISDVAGTGDAMWQGITALDDGAFRHNSMTIYPNRDGSCTVYDFRDTEPGE